jgi:subtilase family serine protease
MGCSWGGPDEGWQPQERAMMKKAIALCAANGILFGASAGDDGANDGTAGKTCDYPASDSGSFACCGTRLLVNADGSYASESVWNNGVNGGATGGGISAVEPRPSYQSALAIPGNGRIVGDFTSNGDPDSGTLIWMGGSPTPIGGTSAVPPRLAGFAAVYQIVTGKPPGDWHAALYANYSTICNDVTVGNNNGYSAGVGFDVPSGCGSLRVDKWIALGEGGVVPPPNGGGNGNPPPPATGPTKNDVRNKVMTPLIAMEKIIGRHFFHTNTEVIGDLNAAMSQIDVGLTSLFPNG